MIARPPRTIPVPDAVALLAGRQLPTRVQAAFEQAGDAVWRLHLARGERYEEARQEQQARIAAANKVLAAHNPGLIHGWADVPAATRNH